MRSDTRGLSSPGGAYRAARSGRGTRTLSSTARALLAGLVLAIAAATAALLPLPAYAVGAPVVIDDFAGAVLGNRQVTGLPGADSTTPPGQFDQSDGVGVMVMSGSGDQPGGVQLDYDFPSTDLTVRGSNKSLVADFTSIQRLPESDSLARAATLTVSVTDADGAVGAYSLGSGNSSGLTLEVSFSCDAATACLAPQVDPTRVTHLRLLVSYPTSGDPDASLTVGVDAIRATPGGTTAPPAPTTAVSAPGEGTVYAASGTSLDFTVSFTSGGYPVAVSRTSATDDGLQPADVVADGSAEGATEVSISGGPSSYSVRIGPLTGSGSVRLRVPAGAVVDAWGQPNAGSDTAALDFVIAVPPVITSVPSDDAEVGRPYSTTLHATGAPDPTWSVVSGELPPGLELSGSGVLSGTPSQPGTYGFTVRAHNNTGSDEAAVALNVNAAPELGTLARANFRIGVADSVTVRAGGYPRPTISTGDALPAGLSLIDNGDGTAKITGTPILAGDASIELRAANVVGTATRTLTVRVSEPPGFTGGDRATFLRHRADSFDVITTGFTRPVIALTAGELPRGLRFTDHGDGTASIHGTPTGVGGARKVTLAATNEVGSAELVLTITVQSAPIFLSPSVATFAEGVEGSFRIRTDAVPTASITLSGVLPAGLSLIDNGDGTATLRGTPAGPGGTAVVSLTATNSEGSTTKDLAVRINEVPTFTSADAATFTRGRRGTFLITTSGLPAPEITTDSLPRGLRLTDNGDGTATLAGSPNGPGGSRVVPLTARNSLTEARQLLHVEINEPPSITSPDEASWTAGQPGSFTVEAAGFPNAAIAADGDLPAGLVLIDNHDGTATISGTPAGGSGGLLPVTLHATSVAGVDTQNFTVTVLEAPAFQIPGALDFTVGVVGSRPIALAGFPAPRLTTAGLPQGLTLVSDFRGVVTLDGAPTGPAGTFQVNLTATNDVGVAVAAQLVIITDAPVIRSVGQAQFQAGAEGRFDIRATGAPTPVLRTEDALPAGLRLVDDGDGTATLTGRPTTPGEYPVTLAAVSALGTSQQQLIISVRAAPTFTSGAKAVAAVGLTSSVTVTAGGYPVPSLVVRGSLPSGMVFVDRGDGTGMITGSPAPGTAGSYHLTVVADNRPEAGFRLAPPPVGVAVTEQTLEIEVAAASSTGPSPSAEADPAHPEGGGPAVVLGVVGAIVALGAAGAAVTLLIRRRRLPGRPDGSP